MRLTDLVPDGNSKHFAKAKVANLAKHSKGSASSLAALASLALATPPKKPNFTAKAGHGPRELYAEERTALEAYLTQIGETDPVLIADFWNQCQSDPEALTFWLKEAAKELAAKPKPKPSTGVTCGACKHFKRIQQHPNLGHCLQGKPEPLAGFWDSYLHWCEQYEAAP